MQGEPRDAPAAGVDVRPLTEDDLDECAALCKKVHGFERTGALRDSFQGPITPFAALRDGRIVAYASGVNFWPMSHGVAETDEDMQALLLGAASQIDGPILLLVPLHSSLFRWALDQGLRAVKPMNLMARGEYQNPRCLVPLSDLLATIRSQPTSLADPPRLPAGPRRGWARRRRGSRGPPARPHTLAMYRAERARRPTS